MSENFLKFNRKYNLKRLIYSSLAALGAGALLGGAFLILFKLEIIALDPLFAIPIALSSLFFAWAVIGLITYRTDKQLAKALDIRFGLSERVETMLDFKDDESVMLDMQRRDADSALAAVSVKELKVFGLIPSIAALLVGAACLTAGILVPDMRNYVEPEEVIPFELSEMQREGIKELISYTSSSKMEEPYRSETVAVLESLLSTLEQVYTQPQMKQAVSDALSSLQRIAFDSSSMTEIANALWDAEDVYTQMLARMIDTSGWREPDWGDYSEKYAALRALYRHSKKENELLPPEESELIDEIKWKLENSAMKIERALGKLHISESDGLILAIKELAGDGVSDPLVYGFETLSRAVHSMSFEEAERRLDESFAAMSSIIYTELERQRNNTLVSEHVMTKISNIFLVPLPAFEQPDFSKNGESGVGGDNNTEKDDEEQNESAGGGIGTGAVYGSNDLVLDPLTGEYVEYGTLLDKYYSLMDSKLENGEYTEQQKEMIKKYFALLYGGMKKDEGK